MTRKPRLLDLFCGRGGWIKGFLAHGWECYGIDVIEPKLFPNGATFIRADVRDLHFVNSIGKWKLNDSELPLFDFVCASPPCEEFSIHGMKHFHPNPKYPEHGIRLFNHTRFLCAASAVSYVIENVRCAEPFVGPARNHCGPFYLWGNGVPPVMPQGIIKGIRGPSGRFWRKVQSGEWDIKKLREERRKFAKQKPDAKTAEAATIPAELANCVAEYATNIYLAKLTLGA